MDKAICKIGFWACIFAFCANALFLLFQLLQLLEVLTYPYDETLVFGFSLCIVIPFLIEMLALHDVVAHDKKIWSHAALIFTVIYVVFVRVNYVGQLTTVLSIALKGAGDEIKILRQMPHSLFWDSDAIG